MDDIQSRLKSCFTVVFPDLPEAAIVAARQDDVLAWDSVATITLINVIEDEFHVQMDLDRLAEFTSFASIQAYLQT